jgi:hypothetical protein
VPKSILDAIKLGFWDFEPPDVESMLYSATDAMPGTQEKLNVLAARIREGLPLWHPCDRDDMDDPPTAMTGGTATALATPSVAPVRRRRTARIAAKA